jgi:molecular chaperone HscB
MQKVSWPNTTNYYTFYELPIAFHIDLGQLKIKYFEYAKLYHPDFFSLDVQQQSKAIEISAINNKAFKILNNSISRIQYLLELKNISISENSVLPQMFLMEMMELNERIDELDIEDDKEVLKQKIRSEIETQKTEIFEEISESAQQENWSVAKDNLLKWRYLERLLERVL